MELHGTLLDLFQQVHNLYLFWLQHELTAIHQSFLHSAGLKLNLQYHDHQQVQCN